MTTEERLARLEETFRDFVTKLWMTDKITYDEYCCVYDGLAKEEETTK